MSSFTKVQFKAGDVVFWTGDVADKLYILETGAIRLLDSNSTHPFATLAQGQSFGEQCILSSGIRSASAMAMEDSECVVIGGDGLRQLLANQSPMVSSLFQALLLQLQMHNTLLR